MILALALSAALLGAQEEPPKEKSAPPAIRLKVNPDGSAEATVTGKDGATKTYRADSLEELAKQHPELDLSPWLEKKQEEPEPPPAAPRSRSRSITLKLKPGGGIEATVTEEADGKKTSKTYSAESMEELKKQLPELDFDLKIQPFGKGGREGWRDLPLEDQLRKHLEELDKSMERLRRQFERGEHPTPPAPAPVFGIRAAPVDEALASHLGLKEGEGLVARDVDPKSAADRAGVHRHDILLKIDGETIEDVESFRKAFLKARSKGFLLEVLRRGKHKTLKVPAEL